VGCFVSVLAAIVLFFLVDLAVRFMPWWGWFTFVPLGIVAGVGILVGLSE